MSIYDETAVLLKPLSTENVKLKGTVQLAVAAASLPPSSIAF